VGARAAARRLLAARRPVPAVGGGARARPRGAARRVCAGTLAMHGALHLGSALLRPDQGRRTETLRLKTSGSSAAARVPDQAALCAGAMHARQSRCARLRPPMLVLHVSAACALAVRTRCCACPCCAFPCCAPSCWACCVLVQRSSRRIVRISLVNVVDIAGVYRPWRCTCLRCARLRFPYSRYFYLLFVPLRFPCSRCLHLLCVPLLCVPALCAFVRRVQRSPTSCGAR